MAKERISAGGLATALAAPIAVALLALLALPGCRASPCDLLCRNPCGPTLRGVQAPAPASQTANVPKGSGALRAMAY